jgi:hypothetical protein
LAILKIAGVFMYKVIISVFVWLASISAHASELFVRTASNILVFKVSDGLQGQQVLEAGQPELINLLKTATLVEIKEMKEINSGGGYTDTRSGLVADRVGTWTESSKREK